MSVIVDRSEHPSYGKGRPSCPTCRGLGVLVVSDNARGRVAGLQFPGAFKCACVEPYQAKIRKRAERLEQTRRDRARAFLKAQPHASDGSPIVDVADLVELQEQAEAGRLTLDREVAE